MLHSTSSGGDGIKMGHMTFVLVGTDRQELQPEGSGLQRLGSGPHSWETVCARLQLQLRNRYWLSQEFPWLIRTL